MPAPKPLAPDEIPQEFRAFVDFDSQHLALSHRKTHRMYATVTCPRCNGKRDVRVSAIRQRLNNNEHWTGMCRSCFGKIQGTKISNRNKTPFRPLALSEIPNKFHRFIHLDSQHFREHHGRQYLYLIITCPDCGNDRTLKVHNVREYLKTGSLNCKSCAWDKRAQKQQGRLNLPRTVGPAWQGGRYVDSDGYIHRHRATFSLWEQEVLRGMFTRDSPTKQGIILEHRAIVALSLGRPLQPKELVHHINGNREDNRPENLHLVNHHNEPICPRCGWPMEAEGTVPSQHTIVNT